MKSVTGKLLAASALAAGFSIWGVPVNAALLSTSCTTTASNLNFGNYNPLAATVVKINSTITINCSATLSLGGGTVNYTIALSPGNSNNYAMRNLLSGTNSLNYNLYTDSTYSVVWGDGSGGTSAVAGSGDITLVLSHFTNTATVYGRIPAPQITVVPGQYSDTIQVTVSY